MFFYTEKELKELMDDSCKEIIKKIAIVKKLWPFLRGGLFCFSTLYIRMLCPGRFILVESVGL